MTEPPQVSAIAHIAVTKPPAKKRWGTFTSAQMELISKAGSLVGAHAGREFVEECFRSIPRRVSDDELNFALRQLLDEYDSSDLVDQVFKGVQNATLSQS